MIKSQDDLNTCNSGERSVDVLIHTVEKCEKLQKQLDEANTIILLCKKAYMFPEDTMKFLCTYIKKWELEK